MATVKRFEELEIWTMAREQCNRIFKTIVIPAFGHSASLQHQIDRSSGSVMDNVSEGFDRFSRADFRHFLVIARGSNAEVRSQLYRALDRKMITELQHKELINFSVSLGVKIHNLMSYLSHSVYKNKPIPQYTEKEQFLKEVEVSYSIQDALSLELPDEFIL